MTDAPQPPPGWQPPNPPTAPPPPPPTSPAGYPPPPPPATPPGWAAPPTPGSGLLPPPPGSPGFGYGYTPVGGQGRTLGGIATALTVLLCIVGFTAVFSAYALRERASLIEDGGFTLQEAEDADALVVGAVGLSFLVSLATAVLWIIWQHRHAKNAEALGKRDGLGAGWAIGGWFIPFANVVLGPLQLLQSARWSDPDRPGRAAVAPSLIVWWVLLVVAGIGRIRVGFTAGTVEDTLDLDDVRRADEAGALGGLLTAIAAVAAIVLVRQLTQRQHEALRRRGLLA